MARRAVQGEELTVRRHVDLLRVASAVCPPAAARR
jgi:hypothetical protein